MKRLTCEMCGSTNLVKQDSLFVCQDCGTKYSVEEAKKMMVEGTVHVQNAAQLENLLNMARSSFDSKNYAKAEEFCNQVIAMDDKNYEAWKLKGEAINYQISVKNQRILEVYNCIMTSYRVLDDAGKEEKKHEIISSLKTCLEGEVEFWLDHLEADRPTDANLLRAENAYVDAYNKMKAAFEELGLEDEKEEYLTYFDNLFIGNCNAICNSAWETTVGYNYYRDYMGKGVDPFGRSDKRWVIKDTDLYRPMKKTWDTFKNETDNLIKLLQFAEEQFNEDTDPKVMEAIYSNIAYFEECVIPSGSWKITQGYTSKWDEYKTVGWHEEYSLTEEAKQIRREIMEKYKEKERNIAEQAEALLKAKKEKERRKRVEKYWKEHAAEKERLENEQADIRKRISELNSQIEAVDKVNEPRIAELMKIREEKLPAEIECDRQEQVVEELENQRKKCGIFKAKEKKALTERLENEKPRLEELKKKAAEEKKRHQDKIDAQIAEIKNERKDLRDEVAKLSKRDSEITIELTKDR